MEHRLLRRQRPLRLVHKFEVGIARFCGAKEFAKMTKAVKQQSTKKGQGEGQHVQGGAQPGTVQPAQEIADDEVEIGETGGKPGTNSTPVTESKPRLSVNMTPPRRRQ
jgi:hypothetical protein